MSRLYIFVRNDLDSLNPGKAMAQCSHASAQFITKYPKLAEEWLKQADGFGTTIVLEGSKFSIEQLFKYSDFSVHDAKGEVVDPTYPFKLQRELLGIARFSDEINLVYDLNDKPDENGFIPATRRETTCYWIFVQDENENFTESMKNYCSAYSIFLHR